jgi:hypothetical protein
VQHKIEIIDINRIFLYEENPRHEPLQSQEEIIEHLCKDEQVFALARSIAEKGTNPLEIFGLVQLSGSGKSGTKKNFEVWEGNRRACAIKLLNDPDLAPPTLRKDFVRLSTEYDPVREVAAVVFDDHETLKFWMDVIHGGQQGGVGRKNWSADQKTRHTGSGGRNKVAQALLDVSEAAGLITKEERSGKLTTVQRYLNNNVVREALGIDATNPDDVTYNRPVEDFNKLLARFISDVKSAEITSRHNKDQITAYGRTLARTPKVSSERVAPQSLKTVAAEARKARRRAPRNPRKQNHIEYDVALEQALEGLGNRKLKSLYYSLSAVSLEHHTPLITIGAWAFIESLTALCGKNDKTDFVSFYSNTRLEACGAAGKKGGTVRDALQRIQRFGNATKHHEIAGSFDGSQLANDVATITPVLVKTLEQHAAKS